MGWEDAPIVSTAPKQEAWAAAPIVYPASEPRSASGVFDAIKAGYQGSVQGLASRGKLPDVQLSPTDSAWYERLAAGATQLAIDFPLMVAGGVAGAAAGGAAGSVVPVIGNVAGATIGGGAGAFAMPAAIRESYIQAYKNGEITGWGDFLNRAAIVLKHTGKEAAVGALTAGLGKGVGMAMETAGYGAKATAAATLGTEAGTLVVAPAALDGRAPEPQDFLDAAILLVGLKGATVGARKMADIYAKTGKTPVEVLADAKADPSIKEDLVVAMAAKSELAVSSREAKPGEQLNLFPEEQIPRAYQELARQENARNAVPDPSPEAAKFVEKPFADVPQLPGEPALKTHVNYSYLNAAEDVKGAMSRLSELYETKINEATRGTVPWEQTYAEARAMFESATGEKAPELALGNNDYAKLSADLYARKQILTSGAEQLIAQQKAYVEARDAGMATPQMKLELLAQIDRVAQAQAAVRGSQAEVGRALNILKSTNRDKAYYDELTGIIDGRFGIEGKKLGDANFDTMVDMMGQLGSPKEALKFAEKASKATTWEKVVEAWKAGLVSGPITQVANILGNSTFIAVRPLVDTVAVGIGRARRSTEAMSAAEPLARIVGNIHGVIDGAKVLAASTVVTAKGVAGAGAQMGKAALTADKAGVKEGWNKLGVALDGDVTAVTKTESRRNAIEGTTGAIIRAPFKLLGAADDFFRILNERGEAYSLATRQAINEGYNPATREFRTRAAELAANPTDTMVKEIEAAGVRFTFNTPLGEKGKQLQGLIRDYRLQWAVPFVQTPANVVKEMMRLTPAAPVVKEWRDSIAAGGAAKDKALAEMVIGTTVGAAVFSFALSGSISGQGDPDPKKFAAQLASGWQPYSVKIGDKWHSYQRLQPIGTLIGMAADSAFAWDRMTPEESDKVPKILAIAFANAITNQTFLQGITNLVNAVSDPTRFGPKFIQNLAGSLVPGILAQTASMMDPYQREVYSVLDAVQNRIPGLREDLLPKRDIYGEKIEARDRLGAISPITVSEPSSDKVRQEVARLGVGVGKAPDHIELPAGRDSKLGKVSLTPEQRDAFATAAGQQAHQVLTLLVNSPGWDSLPDMAQRNAIAKVFEVSRYAGRAAAVSPEQLRAEAQRIADELKIRMQPK